jgi:hypothetical protein
MSEASSAPSKRQAKKAARAKMAQLDREQRAAARALADSTRERPDFGRTITFSVDRLELPKPPYFDETKFAYAPSAAAEAVSRRDVDPDWVDDPEYPTRREPAAAPAVLGTPGSATDTPISLTIRRSGDDPVTVSVYATTTIETIKRCLVDMGLCGSLHHCDIKFSHISLENGRTLADYGIRTDTSVSYVPLFG